MRNDDTANLKTEKLNSIDCGSELAMKKNMDKYISKNDIVVFLIPNKKYSAALDNIIKTVSKSYKKICYVSLNKPCYTVAKAFSEAKADTKKLFFIDCVSQNARQSKGINVSYVSSPKALTELNIAINKVLGIQKTEIIVFDSLSTLLVYQQTQTIIKFVHSIISTLRNKSSKAVFLCLKEDIKTDLIKDISMFEWTQYMRL